MNRIARRAVAVLAVTTTTTAVAVAAVFTVQPAWAARYSAPLRTVVANLRVAVEVRAGYDRDLFPHWIDADRDRCNTRYEVLIAEAATKPTVGSFCALTGGRWYSYYDNTYWTDPADIDIDHFIPLAEAWNSGARTWTTSVRQGFANDLGDHRALVAVTDNINQSKGDQDLEPGCCRTVRAGVGTSPNGSP